MPHDPWKSSTLAGLALLAAVACSDTGDGNPDAAGAPDAAPGADATATCQLDVAPEPRLAITREGAVRGVRAGETWAYLGIPYARPPLGPLRWQPPASVECRDEILEATSWPPACPQKFTPQGSGETEILGDEDCLYLNVWQPSSAGEPRPVMFFIHGGGNVQGSASQLALGTHLFDGQSLAERGDVVVVTINYRLGPLGFLAHPALSAASEHGGSGNYGLLDQLAALRWVQENIGAFGGDPARVMVFGESAGAVDTCVLATSPLSEGLMHRALMQSGLCHAASLGQGETTGVEYVADMGCGDAAEPIECLRAIDAIELVEDLPPVFSSGRFTGGGFGPVIDGHVVPSYPADALAAGAAADIPLVIGANAEETSILVPAGSVTPASWAAELAAAFDEPLLSVATALYPPGSTSIQARAAKIAFTSDGQFICPSRAYARAAIEGGGQAWRYFYTHAPTGLAGLVNGAFHGVELFYVFDVLEGLEGYTVSDDDRAVAAAMQGYWSRLAHTGDPNGDDAPAWPAYTVDDPYLELAAPPAAGTGVRPEACDFWDALGIY